MLMVRQDLPAGVNYIQRCANCIKFIFIYMKKDSPSVNTRPLIKRVRTQASHRLIMPISDLIDLEKVM